MAYLDLIVTHCRESWAVCRGFFEMLRIQRGVAWETGSARVTRPNAGPSLPARDWRVILVQDGDEGALDTRRMTRAYPFVDQVITLPHGGVSAARNAGLDASDAEWVMFCDIDDCLYSVDSLYRILQSLREAGDRADIVWSPFWIEMRTKDGKFGKVLKEWNSVFIHGKCYRRAFLAEHGIRFDEELTYSEDALFNAVAIMETTSARIAKMPENVYMWCYREESLSNYTGGDLARTRSLFKKRVRLCEEYEKRGLRYEAKTAAARALMDYYWEINGGDPPEGMSEREWIGMPLLILHGWPGCIMDISPADRKLLYKITKEEAQSKGHVREGMPGMQEWMETIGAVVRKG